VTRTCGSCGEPALYTVASTGRPVCCVHANGQVVAPLLVTMADLIDLRGRLVAFAHALASKRPHPATSYEDKTEQAVAECKASTGDALLKALGAGVKP
jgi:hypothetical protein